MLGLRMLKIRAQQAQHMKCASHQRGRSRLGFERVARVAHIFIAQPVGENDHHRAGDRAKFVGVDPHRAPGAQARQQSFDRLPLGLEHALKP